MALLDKYSAPLSAKAAEHLLRRTMFGATRDNITALTGMTIDGALDLLLKDQALPAPPIDPQTGQTWLNTTTRDVQDGVKNAYMKAWWMGLMIRQPLSIMEKMTLFWHNHFPSQWTVVNDTRYMYKQHQTLRSHALGNFKTLVREITLDPAMLRYLNGNRNTAAAPQENYARELQELFTIGKGTEIAQGNYTTYTEEDVRAAARVLTGWTDNTTTVTSSFAVGRHDTRDKQFSAAYQNTVIRGRNNANAGVDELNDLLDMIFRQSATSEYIVTKLYRFFINSTIPSAVASEFIKPLAKIFRDNNYQIKPVLRAMFGSTHFFDEAIMGCMIKTPLDLLIGTIRQLGIATPDPSTQATLFYNFMRAMQSLSAQLQQDVFELPDVAGWQAFYQEPLFYQIWINTATMPRRSDFANTVLSGWTLAPNQRVTFDSITFLQGLSTPGKAADVVEYCAQHFFAIDLTQEQKNYLTNTVLLGGFPAGVWAEEWSAYTLAPNDMNKKNLVKTKLDNLVRYMMRLAEYQIN